MTLQELNQFIIQYNKLKDLAWKRGKEALLVTETGFGEKCTGYERVIFMENHIKVVCYDTCYDLHDESSYCLSFEEFLMTDEEWQQHLVELKEIIEENKRIKAEQEKLRKLEQAEKEFFRLKKELGK